MTTKSQQFLDICLQEWGDEPRIVASKDILHLSKKYKIKAISKVLNTENKAGKRGVYHFPPVTGVAVVPTTVAPAPQNESKPVTHADLSVQTDGFSDNLIPAKDSLFVPFGNFKVVRDIIKSKMFYPVFITGLSGNGKTYMVEQACAATKREVIRVNLTRETDEDDLIGGFRLIDGSTKFFKGPVIKAMERGAVLLLDEIDLADPAKIMALQSILEGKGYFIKKTGEHVSPAAGFTIVATANTKGKGSDDGRFIGTNILNEAFLERYPITCEQDYPNVSVEKKILSKVADTVSVEDDEFIQKLTDWADIIRKTFAEGGVDEIISTRRLVHIVKAHAIFKNRMTAIEMCTNRFDDETKNAFKDLYAALDANVETTTSSNESTDDSL